MLAILELGKIYFLPLLSSSKRLSEYSSNSSIDQQSSESTRALVARYIDKRTIRVKRKFTKFKLDMSSDQPKLTRSMSKRFYRFESLGQQLIDKLGDQQPDPNLWVFEVAWEVANKGEDLGICRQTE